MEEFNMDVGVGILATGGMWQTGLVVVDCAPCWVSSMGPLTLITLLLCSRSWGVSQEPQPWLWPHLQGLTPKTRGHITSVHDHCVWSQRIWWIKQRSCTVQGHGQHPVNLIMVSISLFLKNKEPQWSCGWTFKDEVLFMHSLTRCFVALERCR